MDEFYVAQGNFIEKIEYFICLKIETPSFDVIFWTFISYRDIRII